MLDYKMLKRHVLIERYESIVYMRNEQLIRMNFAISHMAKVNSVSFSSCPQRTWHCTELGGSLLSLLLELVPRLNPIR